MLILACIPGYDPMSSIMKWLLNLAVWECTGMVMTVNAQTIHFDAQETGKPPAGWTPTKTGKGDPRWRVVADSTAPSKPNVLKQ